MARGEEEEEKKGEKLERPIPPRFGSTGVFFFGGCDVSTAASRRAPHVCSRRTRARPSPASRRGRCPGMVSTADTAVRLRRIARLGCGRKVAMSPANVNMYINNVPFGKSRLTYGLTGTHCMRSGIRAGCASCEPPAVFCASGRIHVRRGPGESRLESALGSPSGEPVPSNARQMCP